MTKSELIDILKETGKKGSVYGLEAVTALAAACENPEKGLKIIHVAGTNGKGSVLSFISSVLTAAGYKTGTYSSPAVMSFFDKIKIDGKEISETEYLAEAEIILKAAEENRLSPTLFELETIIAFDYFKKADCDFVIAETGLGGSLDATNYITSPVLTVITSIGLDHTALLGKTIGEIAEAKAGIIKEGVPVVTAEKGEAFEVIAAKAKENKAPVITAEPADLTPLDFGLWGQSFALKDGREIKISLLGSYQRKNAATALKAIEALKESGVIISPESIQKGMYSAENPGRMKVVSQNPVFICDGAHNPQGAAALKESVKRLFNDKKLILIMGILKDKDYDGILKELLPLAKYVIAVTPKTERALNADIIVKAANKENIKAEKADFKEACEIAKKTAARDDVVLACGSLSFMGEIIKIWKE